MIPLPIFASIRAALEQPIFPGKVIVWLLFMLSIVGWVMIISKFLQFRRIRRADLEFTDRLRKSKTTLEAYEEEWEEEHSLKYLIYLSGAQEAARLLRGARAAQETGASSPSLVGVLVGRQFEFLNRAFHAGFRMAARQLHSGIDGLLLIGVSALFLGTFGLAWSLMKSVDTASEFSEMAPMIGGGLGHLVIALCVAFPTIVVRIILRGEARSRMDELERFRDDINRLFERSFAAGPEPHSTVDREVPPQAQTPPPAPASTPAPEPTKREEKKRFHSIRDRLLRTDSEVDSHLDEPYPVNPIARQTATLSGKGGPKPKY